MSSISSDMTALCISLAEEGRRRSEQQQQQHVRGVNFAGTYERRGLDSEKYDRSGVGIGVQQEDVDVKRFEGGGEKVVRRIEEDFVYDGTGHFR